MVRQKKVQQTTADLPPTPGFPLNPGRLLDVLRSRAAAQLQCAMADGDQRIFPIAGEADPTGATEHDSFSLCPLNYFIFLSSEHCLRPIGGRLKQP
jgi:hypothetical protein